MRTVRGPIREALEALGVRRLLLGIHDAAFPMGPEEDVGRGTPHSAAAGDLLELAAGLGFDGLQLGPQGATSRSNPSPYDGALFSRDPLSISLPPLATATWGHLVSPRTVEAVVGGRPRGDRVAHAYAFDAVSGALAEASATFRERRAAADPEIADLAARLERFRASNAAWLLRDGLFEALRRAHGGQTWTRWPAADRNLFARDADAAAEARRDALLARHAGALEDFALVQLLAHAQHEVFRARARALGLVLFADLQIGLSERDAWAARAFTLAGWALGAPPSRTDPEGQRWGFPVLDPLRYVEGGAAGAQDGPALRFLRARAAKVFAEADGLRIDHPHGLVTPWVYRPEGDLLAAVRGGARLLDSPAVPEHPDLARFAIARADQIDPSVPRYDDGWVSALDPAQVERYAVLLDAIVAAAPGPDAIACEILSTLPLPLARVIARHRLGRFRVTQKASLDDPADVYRSENARPEDWIMLGSHDTPPIRAVAEGWVADGSARRRADRLAARLLAPGEDRDAWARRTAADAAALAEACLAELFVGPARQVMIHFGDLVGEREPYNVPGTVSDANWSLRLPPGVARWHAARVAAREAPDLSRALARALRARGIAPGRPALVAALEGGAADR